MELEKLLSLTEDEMIEIFEVRVSQFLDDYPEMVPYFFACFIRARRDLREAIKKDPSIENPDKYYTEADRKELEEICKRIEEYERAEENECEEE